MTGRSATERTFASAARGRFDAEDGPAVVALQAVDTEGTAANLAPQAVNIEGAAANLALQAVDTEGAAANLARHAVNTEGAAANLALQAVDTEGLAANLAPQAADTEGSAAHLALPAADIEDFSATLTPLREADGERPTGRGFVSDPDRSTAVGVEARAAERPKARSGWAPTVALEMGGFDEQLRVRTDGVDTYSQRGQVRAGLALGIAHPVVRLSDWLALDGLASVGLGITFGSGHWLVPLREDLTFAFTLAHWLTLRAGLGLGITADVSAAQRSFAELAIPVSVTFWRTVELAWRPMLSLPLGSETQAVLGGERALATRVEVLPFDVQLRFRLGGASW